MITYAKNDECTEVTASINGCKDDVVNMIRKTIGEDGMSPEIIRAATIKDTFKSKVKCHPEDVFVESVGQEIAKHSVLDDYHTAANKALRRVNKLLEEQLKRSKKRLKKAVRKCAKHAS